MRSTLGLLLALLTLCSASPFVIRTTDGGATWISNSLPDPILQPGCIYALDDKRAWAGMYHAPDLIYSWDLYQTTDGGATWNRDSIAILDSEIDVVHFFDETIGVVVGSWMPGTIPPDTLWPILRTSDGGANWSRVQEAGPAKSGDPVYHEFTATANCIWFPLAGPKANSGDQQTKD